MQVKSVDIYVYKLNNTTFEPIGQINNFTSLIWPDKYNGYATFELNAPITQENRELIKTGNVLWCGGDNAAMIEIISAESDENGQKKFNVKGRTLEMLLTTRCLTDTTYVCLNKHVSTAMYEIVEQNILPSKYPNDWRRIPYLECAEDEELGNLVSFQKTGGEVYEALESLATDSELGFEVLFRPKEQKLIFRVTEGVDRSNQGTLEFVALSTELDDILSSTYYTNNQGLKTFAHVAGEGEGTERKWTQTGDTISQGFERRDMYVDARDIQSEVAVSPDYNDGLQLMMIGIDNYYDLLMDRGNEKLAECTAVETYEAKVRMTGDTQFVYGVDYSKGDKILIRDTELGVQVAARVTEVSENFDDKHETVITFGYEAPTLTQKVFRKTKIQFS